MNNMQSDESIVGFKINIPPNQEARGTADLFGARREDAETT
jgi:hypothetical protein